MGGALITGASSGIGLELAKLFAKEGHSLVLVARRKEALEKIAVELKAAGPVDRVEVVEADLSQAGAGGRIFARVKELGFQVDYLVNNAGFGTHGPFNRLALGDELKMIDLNIRALVELTHLFLPEMIERKKGRVLNVGSMAGFLPGPYMTSYYATKAFVNSFSEGLHEELKGTGVSCTVLTPGATATGFADRAGVGKSKLFNSPLLASSTDVAECGYRGMMAGKVIAMPGIMNGVQLQMLRLAPRLLTRKLAAWLHQKLKN